MYEMYLRGNIARTSTTVRSLFTNVKEGPFNFVDGRRRQPDDSNRVIDVIEPASGEKICQMRSSGREEVDAAVANSKSAYVSWSKVYIADWHGCFQLTDV